MTRRGYAVHGFDLSEEMLEFARARTARGKGRAGAKPTLTVDRMEAFRTRGRGGDTARGVGEDAHGAETCADSVVIQSRDVGTSGRKPFGAYRRVVLQWRSAFAANTFTC